MHQNRHSRELANPQKNEHIRAYLKNQKLDIYILTQHRINGVPHDELGYKSQATVTHRHVVGGFQLFGDAEVAQLNNILTLAQKDVCWLDVTATETSVTVSNNGA